MSGPTMRVWIVSVPSKAWDRLGAGHVPDDLGERIGSFRFFFLDRVPLEYSIGVVDLRCGRRLDAVVLGWPGAAQDRLRADVSDAQPCRLAGRGDQAKAAVLLVLRHENAVLRRHAGRVRYEPADRVWFSALARLIPRRRWTEVFPVTPATLLAWHRRLAAKKYDTSKRRKPGRPPTGLRRATGSGPVVVN
jgi:hypothetical protein